MIGIVLRVRFGQSTHNSGDKNAEMGCRDQIKQGASTTMFPLDIRPIHVKNLTDARTNNRRTHHLGDGVDLRLPSLTVCVVKRMSKDCFLEVTRDLRDFFPWSLLANTWVLICCSVVFLVPRSRFTLRSICGRFVRDQAVARDFMIAGVKHRVNATSKQQD